MHIDHFGLLTINYQICSSKRSFQNRHLFGKGYQTHLTSKSLVETRKIFWRQRSNDHWGIMRVSDFGKKILLPCTTPDNAGKVLKTFWLFLKCEFSATFCQPLWWEYQLRLCLSLADAVSVGWFRVTVSRILHIIIKSSAALKLWLYVFRNFRIYHCFRFDLSNYLLFNHFVATYIKIGFSWSYRGEPWKCQNLKVSELIFATNLKVSEYEFVRIWKCKKMKF